MKVLVVPEASFVNLFLIQRLIVKRNHAEMGRSWKHLPILLQKSLSCNHISLQHPFIEKKRAQRFTDDDINFPLWNPQRADIFNPLFEHFNNMGKAIGLDQSTG